MVIKLILNCLPYYFVIGYFYPPRVPQQPSYNSQQKWAHSHAQASSRSYAKNKGHAAVVSGYGGKYAPILPTRT